MPFTARILAKDVITAGPGETAAAAAGRMAENKIGAVVVAEGGKLLGIVTERDVTFRVVAKGLDPAKTPLADVMTPKPQTLQANDPLESVFDALSQGARRHLPILEGEEIIGMVSLHDCAGLLTDLSRDQEIIKKFAEVALASPRQIFRLRKA